VVGRLEHPPARPRARDQGRLTVPAGSYAGVLQLDVIRPGLWRWTVPHPDWEPAEPGSSGDWPQEVGCVLYETQGLAVWIDPLAPAQDGAFWEWADARCAERDVVVLETLPFHRRSSERLISRYAASSRPPEGVEAFPFPALGETMYWIAEHRALVPGDRLLTSGADGELSLCPQSWLRHLDPVPTPAEAAATLALLRGLDVELVLVSHGEPVLDGAAAALAHALEHAA
jgi:hypothetical protein